jgi:NADPH:quinone reductase-like Zn-dependent oxidoreductase
MHTVIVRSFGGPEVLELARVPVPVPGPGQVRIAVEAAAVNPVDIGTRAGWLAQGGLMPDAATAIGWDVAGTIDAGEAGGFAPGDRVIGLRDLLTAPGGAQADYVVLDASAVAPAPRTATAAEASTLPLNGLTASQALDLLALEAGDWLLVTGAAGAVGGFAVELAVLRGLRVVGVARAGDEQLVRGLGAEAFVAATDELGSAVRAVVPGGVDGALDAAVIGMPALDAVRGGGAFVAVLAGGAPASPLRGTRIEQVWIRADGARLAELSALVDGGRLTLRVAGTYPLADVARAQERLAAGGLRGRLVLQP